MSFFGEIARALGWDEAKSALGYHYINFNGAAVYVEGVKSVLRVDGEEMAFAVPGGILYVGGKDLCVDDLRGADVTVRGEIAYVETSASAARKKRQKKEGV